MQMPTQQRLRAFLGKQVKKCDRIAFLSAFIIGVFTHIFMFNNYLLNHDGLFYQFSDNELTSSGRWFLFVPSALSGDMSVPWINGVLAIFALSLACVFIVRLLRIERPFWVVLTAAVIVTFPVLADTFAYMFVADAFMIALLLSVLGVYLTDRRRFGFLPGAVLLALSMGCYQAYFCFAFGLVYIRGMQLLLDEKQSAKELWRKAARFLLALVLGLALYYVAMKAALAVRGTALVEYQGIDKAFAFSLKDFLFRALYAYLGFRRTILSNSPIFATAVQRGARVACRSAVFAAAAAPTGNRHASGGGRREGGVSPFRRTSFIRPGVESARSASAAVSGFAGRTVAALLQLCFLAAEVRACAPCICRACWWSYSPPSPSGWSRTCSRA